MKAASVVAFAVFVACASGACGGQTTGGGSPPSLAGTIGGKPVPAVTDSTGVFGVSAVSGSVVTSYAGVILTNVPNICTVLQQGGNPANATALSLTVSTSSMSGTVPAGTYAVQMLPGPVGAAPATMASAEYVVQDATCTSTTEESAQSGTITLSTVSASLVAGTFDVTFPSGDHLSGSFASPICGVGPGQGQAQPVCKSY